MLQHITLMTTTKPVYQAASSPDKITLNSADAICTEKLEKTLTHVLANPKANITHKPRDPSTGQHMQCHKVMQSVPY